MTQLFNDYYKIHAIKDVEEKYTTDIQIHTCQAQGILKSNLPLISFLLTPKGKKKKKNQLFMIHHFLQIIKNELKIQRMDCEHLLVFLLELSFPQKRQLLPCQRLPLCWTECSAPDMWQKIKLCVRQDEHIPRNHSENMEW